MDVNLSNNRNSEQLALKGLKAIRTGPFLMFNVNVDRFRYKLILSGPCVLSQVRRIVDLSLRTPRHHTLSPDVDLLADRHAGRHDEQD